MTYKYSHTGQDFAAKYDSSIGNIFESRIYRAEYVVLLKLLKKYYKSTNISIMDFACGTGRITNLLYTSGYTNITGVDISQDMLDVAKIKYPDINFLKMDVEQEKFDQQFDLVIAFRFFLNADQNLKEKIFRSMYGIIKDKGHLIFNIHMNRFSIPFLFSFLKYQFGLTKIKQNGLSYFDVKQLVVQYGYKIVAHRGYSFFLGIPYLSRVPYKLFYYLDAFIGFFRIFDILSKDIIYIVAKSHEEN